jgi:hypothetical protein
MKKYLKCLHKVFFIVKKNKALFICYLCLVSCNDPVKVEMISDKTIIEILHEKSDSLLRLKTDYVRFEYISRELYHPFTTIIEGDHKKSFIDSAVFVSSNTFKTLSSYGKELSMASCSIGYDTLYNVIYESYSFSNPKELIDP